MQGVELTLGEAVQLLQPPITEKQLRAIINALHWQPAGRRRIGHRGRPQDVYDWRDLIQLHDAIKPFVR